MIPNDDGFEPIPRVCPDCEKKDIYIELIETPYKPLVDKYVCPKCGHSETQEFLRK